AGGSPLPYEERLRWVLAGLDCALLTAVAVLHWRRWRLGHDLVQFALMLAAAMSMAALLSLRLGETWRLSWWDYHGYLLAGFGGAVYAVWARFRQTRAVDDVLAATFEHDPMAHIVSGYPEALRTLVRAVEVKDAYTHGHSERTARIAVQLGQRLRLDEDTLRAIARGGYLHDVGKITIPDHILNKPDRLTPEERAVIETHPSVGYELVVPLPDLREALPTVLHHHERWDGTGYPRGLAGGDIPLVARVVAVADVWDALTSDRAYREGMAPQLALAHIAAGRGSHFQPELVDAFVGLAAEWGYLPATVEVDAIEGWLASQTCHAVGASRA
ncbi:MAG: HD domain-containing protein, partial [Acidimicrobiia bacterium]|nr:HD domain-containing protein [Acidimicrobiia bacterium]